MKSWNWVRQYRWICNEKAKEALKEPWEHPFKSQRKRNQLKSWERQSEKPQGWRDTEVIKAKGRKKFKICNNIKMKEKRERTEPFYKNI